MKMIYIDLANHRLIRSLCLPVFFLLFINDVERKVRSKNADKIRLFGRKMQLVLGYMIDRFSQIH